MFRRFLVPLDGSLLAESVLPASVELAKTFDATLLLLHVLEKGRPRKIHGQRHLAGAQEAQGYLERIAGRLAGPGVAVEVHVHAEASQDAAAGIALHEQEFTFDMVIMSVHGRGRAARLLAGGVAQNVLAAGSKPVLLLHAEDQQAGERFPCRSVLIPTDPAGEHRRSFRLALEFARDLGAPVHIVLAVPTLATLPPKESASGRLMPGTADALLDISADQARLLLAEYRARARSLGLEASTEVLRGHPARTIIKAARLLHSDLVILGTHGKSGMEAFWKGSVAHGIYSRSLLPLLLIPEGTSSPKTE
jgi:nucleotide-binding universal stress UspA family protein